MILPFPLPFVVQAPALATLTYINYVMPGSGATLTMPTHLAPVGDQTDFFLGYAINMSSTTLPTFDTTQGWNQITVPDGVSVTTAMIAFWKWADTNSELFGTHTTANRAIVKHWRFSKQVANPIGALGYAQTPSNNVNATWPGLSGMQPAGSWVDTLLGSRPNTTHSQHNATINQQQQTGANAIALGTSNGTVSSWAEYSGTEGTTSETTSVAVELRAA